MSRRSVPFLNPARPTFLWYDATRGRSPGRMGRMQTLTSSTLTEVAPAYEPAPADAEGPSSSSVVSPTAVGVRGTRDLLAGFAAGDGQSDFEEIVRRYGGMVLKVCWQVTGH